MSPGDGAGITGMAQITEIPELRPPLKAIGREGGVSGDVTEDGLGHSD
jgi:hypothetical protein